VIRICVGVARECQNGRRSQSDVHICGRNVMIPESDDLCGR
jgi:hypothetical protein